MIINVFTCDEGYDWIAEDADPEDDCTDQPDGVGYELEEYGGSETKQPRQAETGEDNPGEARFTGVPAGDYVLTEVDYPTGTFSFILSCESTRRDFADYPYYPFALVSEDGIAYLTIQAGETLECNWYGIPPDPDASEGDGQAGPSTSGLRIEVYTCAGDEQTVDACDPQEEPTRFAVIPIDGGEPETLETEGGSGTIDDLDGVYTLVQVGQQPCVVESTDIDAQGNITLSPTEGTLVRVFNCA